MPGFEGLKPAVLDSSLLLLVAACIDVAKALDNVPTLIVTVLALISAIFVSIM